MREISNILHTDYREQGVRITITSVEISPDLRNGRVFYSILGDENDLRNAQRFFSSRTGEIRQKLSRVIVLKYLPSLRFIHDKSLERGNRVVDILNEIDEAPPANDLDDDEDGPAPHR